MCGIIEAIVASTAIAAASSAANIASQNQAARAQNSYNRRLGIAQNKQYEQNAAAVRQDVLMQTEMLARRNLEQRAATQNELQGIARNVREASGSAAAMQAGAGIEGRSVDLLHAQFAREVAEYESVAARNIRSATTQANMEAQAIYARGQSAINSGYPNPLPPSQTVSPFTSLLNGAATGISVATALNSFQTPNGVGPTANPGTSGQSNFFNPIDPSSWNAVRFLRSF